MKKTVAKTVDAYITDFPAPVQAKLNQIRTAAKKAAPADTTEKISYQMPYLN